VPLDAIKARFGGRVNKQPTPPGKKHLRQCWKWVADSGAAMNFLMAVRPYLRIKGAAADVAIEFQSSMKPNNGWTIGDRAAALATRLSYKERLQRINREEHAI
jgi:hypothetical protein